jgi:hypothetical protein
MKKIFLVQQVMNGDILINMVGDCIVKREVERACSPLFIR